MGIDTAGCDQAAAGVDVLAPGRQRLADGDDRAVADAEVGAITVGGGGHIGVADDQVEAHSSSLQ